MILSLLLKFTLLFRLLAAACSGDNCANHVTGVWGGIGVPIKSRISMCNDYLRATFQPETKTVTTTIHKYTTKLGPQTTTASTTITRSSNTPSSGFFNSTATTTAGYTTTYGIVPAFATAQCPELGQFASACRCWASVTAETMTMTIPTVTITSTSWHEVGCGPAATAVGPKGSYFPCSRQWGTCSCLRSGNFNSSDDNGNVCVRVGAFGPGRNMTGPCAEVEECGIGGECRDGYTCIYDGSCGCGKRRCYKAADNGCEYQGIPIEELKRRRL